MSNITCPVIRDLLPLYADDALSEDSRALVEEHLAVCGACQKELESCKKEVEIAPETEANPLRMLKTRLLRRRVILSLTAVCSTALVLFGLFYFLCNYQIAVPYNPETIRVVSVSGNTVRFTSPPQSYISSLSDRRMETDGKVERVMYLGFARTPMNLLIDEPLSQNRGPSEGTIASGSTDLPVSRIYYCPPVNRIDFLWWSFAFPKETPVEELPLLWEAEGAPLLFAAEAAG